MLRASRRVRTSELFVPKLPGRGPVMLAVRGFLIAARNSIVGRQALRVPSRWSHR